MKHNWGKELFPKIVWFQEGPGVRNTQYRDTGVKLLNVANLVDSHVDLSTSNRYISEEEAYGKYKHFLVDDGDFIIASSGIQASYFHKKMGFINKTHLPLCMNTSTIRFKVLDDSKLNIYFFQYYLKSFDFNLQLQKALTGCAQLNFGPSHLKKMKCPLPPMEVQEQIVAELDKINETIEDCRELLRNLDALAQSLFYDTFGDPISNSKVWNISKVSDNFITGSGGTPSKKIDEYWNSNDIPWIGSNMCQNKVLYETDGKFISTLGLNNSSAKLLYEDTILVALVGATIGKVALLKTNTSTNQNIGFIKPNKDVANPIFLFYLFQGLYPLFTGIGDGKFKMANLSFIRNLPIILPPLELQEKFAERIERIEAQKKAVEQTIAELQTLLDSRMDYYFG